MTLSVQKKFGDTIITKSHTGTPDEEIKAVSFFSQIPNKCTNCNSGNTALNHRSVKGFDYYGVRCLACGAECKFGKYKEGDGFFIKDGGKFTLYKGKEKTEEDTSDPFGD